MHKMLLKKKIQMNIPLYQMISMLIMHHAFKINVLKMEYAFSDYILRKEEGVLCISLELERRGVIFWLLNAHWLFENEQFEHFFFGDLDFKFLSSRMFFVWDGNHRLQAWLPYIQCVYNEDPKWHYSMDSIVLNTSHCLVELFTATTDLNKLDSNFSTMFWILIVLSFHSSHVLDSIY